MDSDERNEGSSKRGSKAERGLSGWGGEGKNKFMIQTFSL